MSSQGQGPPIDDPDAPPSEEELREASRLRDALAGGASDAGRGAPEAATLADALRHAYRPVALAPEQNTRLVENALRLGEPHANKPLATARRARLFVVSFGASAVLAAAAAWMFVVVPGRSPSEPASAAAPAAPAARVAEAKGDAEEKVAVAEALQAEPQTRDARDARRVPDGAPTIVAVRSTQTLFDAPFPRRGGESARIDRIARARGSDLRENRFARWGVR
jgi:hypothetical protein